MRALLLVAAACAALVAAAPASAGGRLVERGIVQSVGPAQVVLRALDGTETTVAIGSTTRMRLNGRPVSLTSIREGFVAEAVTAGPGPALVLRVFGRVRQEAVVGELVRILPRAVVLRRDTGGRLRLLRSGTDLEDYLLEVPPEEGTLLCFRRSCPRAYLPHFRFRFSTPMNSRPFVWDAANPPAVSPR